MASGGELLVLLALIDPSLGLETREVYASLQPLIELHTGVKVLLFDDVSFEDRSAVLRDCAGSAACFAARVAAKVPDAQYLLSVSARPVAGEAIVSMRLVAVRDGRELGLIAERWPAAELRAKLLGCVPELFPETLWDRPGALSVESKPAGAKVTAGAMVCVTPCRLERLRPGEYQVTVDREGYTAWLARTRIAAGEDAHLEATLAEAPAEVPWLWIAGGVVVGAGVAAALAILLQPEPDGLSVCFNGPCMN